MAATSCKNCCCKLQKLLLTSCKNYCKQAAKTAANKLQKLLLESCKNCCNKLQKLQTRLHNGLQTKLQKCCKVCKNYCWNSASLQGCTTGKLQS
jgi:hypothetical protein